MSHLFSLVTIAAAALVVGAGLGISWSHRPGHGQHAFYDPAVSVAAVIDRLEAQAVNDHQAPADHAGVPDDKRDRVYPVEVRLAPPGADDPTLFHYHASAPGSSPPLAAELTRPLPRPTPRPAVTSRVHEPPVASEPSSPYGRHALR